HLGTVAVLLVTGTLVDAPLLRVTIKPGDDNGLLKASQIMIDKPMAVRRDRVGKVIGRADDATMLAVTRSLAVFLGIA
ncbi:MAG TPA: type II toxin-antitoxin system PemK/MazF family toxin, partial [Pseudomonas sp.]|nr:type II toxin-antitoxin system PemK/MazF family toxin [Pseudomonas sp.]